MKKCGVFFLVVLFFCACKPSHPARQEFSPAFKSKNLLIEAIWNGEHVDLGLDFDQEGNTNLVRLKSEIDFMQDSTQIKILPSRIKALEQEWVVDQKNYTLL